MSGCSMLRGARGERETEERLDRIEMMVETTAIEVERIAEANRFMAKLLSERNATVIPPAKSPERVITPH